VGWEKKNRGGCLGWQQDTEQQEEAGPVARPLGTTIRTQCRKASDLFGNNAIRSDRKPEKGSRPQSQSRENKKWWRRSRPC